MAKHADWVPCWLINLHLACWYLWNDADTCVVCSTIYTGAQTTGLYFVFQILGGFEIPFSWQANRYPKAQQSRCQMTVWFCINILNIQESTTTMAISKEHQNVQKMVSAHWLEKAVLGIPTTALENSCRPWHTGMDVAIPRLMWACSSQRLWRHCLIITHTLRTPTIEDFLMSWNSAYMSSSFEAIVLSKIPFKWQNYRKANKYFSAMSMVACTREIALNCVSVDSKLRLLRHIYTQLAGFVSIGDLYVSLQTHTTSLTSLLLPVDVACRNGTRLGGYLNGVMTSSPQFYIGEQQWLQIHLGQEFIV